MDQARGSGGVGRRLRAADSSAPVPGPSAVREAVLACVGDVPGGLPVRALGAAVADRLGVEAASLDPDAILSALGLLIVGGRVDEADGRLRALDVEERRAG